MRRTVTKVLIAGLVVASAISYLAYAGMKEGWVSYHLPVDQFIGNQQFQNQRVRLAGKVATEGLVAKAGKLGANFTLAGESKSLPVVYKGVVPDMFKAECEVVVEGRLDKGGIFQADTMMTKCASKYDAAGHKKDDKTGRAS